MAQNSSRMPGRHFLQIPGPSPVPDRILRAMDTPIIDHRGPEFQVLAKGVLEGIKTIFKTSKPVIIYTATGTGAWEAALVNALSAGDRVLMVETGQFAALWKVMAGKLGLRPEFIATDRRRAEGADAAARHVVQRDRRQGAGGIQDLDPAEIVLGLGRHAQYEQDRLLSLHAGD